ncbi:penicillin acylase family protein [Flagellimonas meridianipacifica]|uniref:Acyl-homoserine-lactone acylase n=1 Tax=Flagellimonas meridianipacifica TaxID=1080225 RepID=A0A2T0MEU4_9FLAO|nr:penicillin acylase family protein [Allomuricauda pacifica]PRX56088.1 acyl-homoserine-lactone acylase [Allomuricauda pacifica]
MKNYLFLLAVSCLISCKQPEKTITENEILWDTYGVPHIYATSDNDLYYMSAWGQMKNHGNLILKLYGEARGTSAELWGEGFEINKALHHLGLYEQLQPAYDNLSLEHQEMLQSFAAGINAYADKNVDELDEKYRKVLPVTPYDIIAHGFRVVNYEFLIRGTFLSNQKIEGGSNSWALSGSKTATGNTMLVVNPHLPWSDLFLWHEQQFITNEYNMYGATLIGNPSITLGFNDNVSWTHTVNTIDNTDLYEIRKEGNTYLLDGEYIPFEEQDYFIKVLQENGTLKNIEFTRKRTKHGIVIKETEDTALAIRFAQMNDLTPLIEQYDLMSKAKSLDDMKNALALRQMPFLNTVYADNAGNIMHHFGGLVPKKNGDWDKWQGVVSGDSSADIWTDYYESDELPTVANPPSGWLQNANDPPFVNTIPTVLDPNDFASHIAPNNMRFRPQRAARLMHEEDSISFDRLVELKHDNKAELALRLHDDLLALKDQTSDSLVLAAIDVMTKWDGSFDANSLGALFFMTFTNTWASEKQTSPFQLSSLLKDTWQYDDPINTPDKFVDNDEVIGIIKKSAQNHLAKYTKLEIPYGDYYKLKMGDLEYPATGGPQHLGVFRIVYANPNEEGKFIGYFGDTFVLVLEMDEEIKAKGLLTYGNSSNPNNKHYGDQLEMFSKNELRNIWFKRSDQEANLELRENKNDM